MAALIGFLPSFCVWRVPLFQLLRTGMLNQPNPNVRLEPSTKAVRISPPPHHHDLFTVGGKSVSRGPASATYPDEGHFLAKAPIALDRSGTLSPGLTGPHRPSQPYCAALAPARTAKSLCRCSVQMLGAAFYWKRGPIQRVARVLPQSKKVTARSHRMGTLVPLCKARFLRTARARLHRAPVARAFLVTTTVLIGFRAIN